MWRGKTRFKLSFYNLFNWSKLDGNIFNNTLPEKKPNRSRVAFIQWTSQISHDETRKEVQINDV